MVESQNMIQHLNKNTGFKSDEPVLVNTNNT